MTHPFHPWFGREFVFLAVRQTWSQDRVFFLDADGRQFSLPVGWTDAAEPDPFVAMAAGRSPVPVRRSGRAAGVDRRPGRRDCKADDAVNVRLITPHSTELTLAVRGIQQLSFTRSISPSRGASDARFIEHGGIIYLHRGEVGNGAEAETDPKEAALAATRTLNPRPEAVRDPEFGSSEFFDARDLVQVKYEMVRRVRVDGAPVTPAAAAFGFSRPSFYEAAAAVDRDGLAGLMPAKPGPRRAHKLTDEVLAYARRLREQDPVDGVGAAGGPRSRRVRDHGAPAVGGAGAGPSAIRKVEARNEITIATAADPAWTATNSCGGGPCPATSTGGGWGWGCCSSVGSRRGCGCAGGLRRFAPTPARAGSPAPGASTAELVGLLASMALAVAARG